MKKISFYIIFCFTCFYFICAGNISFFSKLSKETVSSVCDIDEDATEKETKDSKEGSCEEDTILFTAHINLSCCEQYSIDLYFSEASFLLVHYIVEKTSPPPRA